jgi:ATP-binding cassette subfamily C protein CydC
MRVRDNLLLSRPDAGDADLVRAAQMAQIDVFIQTLPSGYDTWIGEQGLRLSGGQRRRLVIARALFQDAPILILDEATADLDTLTERDVMRSIHGLMSHKTILIITHRLVGLEKLEENHEDFQSRHYRRWTGAANAPAPERYRSRWG